MTKETEKNKFALPPIWCRSICKNAMSETCVENCVIKRDCSGFKLKRGISLIDMPRFPIDSISEMTKEEKFTSVAVYVAKTIDHLKGVQDDAELTPIRRPNYDSSSSSYLPANLEVEALLSSVQETNSIHPPGAERESQEIRLLNWLSQKLEKAM